MVVECLTPLRKFGRGIKISGRKTACPRASANLMGIARGGGGVGGTGALIGGHQPLPATPGRTSQSCLAVQGVHQTGGGGGWGTDWAAWRPFWQ